MHSLNALYAPARLATLAIRSAPLTRLSRFLALVYHLSPALADAP